MNYLWYDTQRDYIQLPVKRILHRMLTAVSAVEFGISPPILLIIVRNPLGTADELERPIQYYVSD